MASSIKKEYKSFPVQEEIELKRVSNGFVADIAALRAELLAVADQLDTDTGVALTTYGAIVAGTPTVTA